MYVILTIFLVLIASAFLSLKAFRTVNKKYVGLISFWLTVIATFIGVFVALALNNYDQHKADISKTISLLELCGYELGQVKLECDISQGLIDADPSIDLETFISSNPISRAEFFDNIMRNELFVRNVSLSTFQALSRVNKNTQKVYAWLDAPKGSVDKGKIYETLGKIILYTQKIIATEIAYLNGEISLKSLDNQNEEHIMSLLSGTGGKRIEFQNEQE